MQSAWTRLGPAHWSALTHKHVSVHAHNGHELRGLVLTVDPVSASLVLVDLKGPGEVRMVLGHAVKQVQVLDQDPDLDQDQRTRLETLFRDSVPAVDQDPDLDLEQTRTRLLDWFRLNHAPVQEQGVELQVAGVVTVTPPYTHLDCVGLNQVVLDRVQRLVQTCPRPGLDQD